MTDGLVTHPIPKGSAGTITLEWLRRYAEAAGDPNPIHLDEAVARAMGLPGIIAHGMLIAGLIHSRAEALIAGEAAFRGARLVHSSTRFKAMTRLGDEVFIAGSWHAAEGGYQLDLQAENGRGEVLVVARVRLAAPGGTV